LVDALVVPKVETPSILEELAVFFAQFPQSEHVKLLAAIESATALVNLREICRVHSFGSILTLCSLAIKED
jgi:citrate lyase beta subunit